MIRTYACLIKSIYIYIYIYRERERERDLTVLCDLTRFSYTKHIFIDELSVC
jgi:hypothetical protein